MKPLKLYIDNCCLNDVAPKDKDWSGTKLGIYLSENSKNGNIEVWASPASALEIAMNKDLDQRHNMARALNTLICGQRMMASKEFFIIADFLNLIEANWSKSTLTNRLEFLKAESSRTYIALMGQMAALKDYDCSKGFMGVLMPKVATQLIHSRIFEKPKEEIQKRIDAVKEKKYSHLEYFKDFKDETFAELEALQLEYEQKEFTVDKNAITLLQKNQKLLIEGYSLDELSFAADQVFVYWEDLSSTIIDFPRIASKWEKKSSFEGKKGISPKPLKKATVDRFLNKAPTINDCRYILKSLVNRFYMQTILTYVSNDIIFKDLEKGLNEGKIPSGGIILDSSHSIAALTCNVFFSRDTRLNASVDYWFNQISKSEGVFRETAKNINELQRKIKEGLNFTE